MKINVATLGDLYLGATYNLVLAWITAPHEEKNMIFTGVKYNPPDKSYWLYFQYGEGEFKGNELGYNFSSIVIADLVEPVKV